MKGLKSKTYKQNDRTFMKILGIIIRLIPVVLIIWFIWAQSNLLLIKKFTYNLEELPKAFVGYNIMHISDICNTKLNVINKAKKANPDIILISGGYENANGDYNKTAKIVEKLTNIAPVYYIYNTKDNGSELNNTGAINITDSVIDVKPNIKDVNTFIKDNYGKAIIKKANKGDKGSLEYIEYIKKELEKSQNSTIKIAGLGLYETDKDAAKLQTLNLIGIETSDITLLLNGNIDNLDTICETHVDIVLFGDTFGKDTLDNGYKKGNYGNHGTKLFVSGGIGKPKEFKRILNFPEIQLITLSDGTVKVKNPLEELISKIIPDVGTIYDNDGGFHDYVIEYGLEQYYEDYGKINWYK